MLLVPGTPCTALCMGDGSAGASGRWYNQGEMVWGGGGYTCLRFVEFKFQAMLAHLGRSVFPEKQVEQETNEIKYRCGSVGVIHIGGNLCPSNRSGFKCAQCQRNKSLVWNFGRRITFGDVVIKKDFFLEEWLAGSSPPPPTWYDVRLRNKETKGERTACACLCRLYQFIKQHR